MRTLRCARSGTEETRMIIDAHGHVTAPDKLYVYKSGLVSHRGAHGRGSAGASDEDIKDALNEPVFGGSSHLAQLKEAGTDMQLVSPRPYQMMHSEQAKLVNWFIEETNNIIWRQTKLYPDVFRGVCGLPQSPGVSPANCLKELERCVKELGFVGCLINPDPGEASGIETPPLGDRYWYPLYEKLVELDVPGHVHSAGCRSDRLPYSLHFINEESIAVVSLLNSNVFKDFPTLKILLSHGGGAIPLHWARFEASVAARARRYTVQRAHAEPLVRHGALFERFAGAADQNGRRGPLFVRHRTARRRNREGPAHREMARRDALPHRSLRLAKRRRQETDLRRQRAGSCSGCKRRTNTRSGVMRLARVGRHMRLLRPLCPHIRATEGNHHQLSG